MNRIISATENEVTRNFVNSQIPESKKLFPLSHRYDKNWLIQNSLGENVLYNLESLCNILDIRPGMRVLDLGSGKAVSAIFLSKEYNVKVWAVDPKTCPTANFQRVAEMNCEDNVLPLRVDAKKLPFPSEYFDIILAVDSFMYYGKTTEYTDYILSFLKPGGQIGIVDICHSNNSVNSIHQENINVVHSLRWWRNLWLGSERLERLVSEIVPDNEFIKTEYIKDVELTNRKDFLAEELSKDQDNLLNIFRMAAIKSEKSAGIH